MRCNLISKINEVCYKYEKCPNACNCPNVLQGIRKKLKQEKEEQEILKKSC